MFTFTGTFLISSLFISVGLFSVSSSPGTENLSSTGVVSKYDRKHIKYLYNIISNKKSGYEDDNLDILVFQKSIPLPNWNEAGKVISAFGSKKQNNLEISKLIKHKLDDS